MYGLNLIITNMQFIILFETLLLNVRNRHKDASSHTIVSKRQMGTVEGVKSLPLMQINLTNTDLGRNWYK